MSLKRLIAGMVIGLGLASWSAASVAQPLVDTGWVA